MQPRGHTQKLKPLRHTIYVCAHTHPHSAAPCGVAAATLLCVCFCALPPIYVLPRVGEPHDEAPGRPPHLSSEQGFLKLIATETTNNG